MEKLIEVEKGIKVKIDKVNKFPKKHVDQLTRSEFDDIYKRAKSTVSGVKKKGSVRTVSGGSTGLVQQKVKKWWESYSLFENTQSQWNSFTLK